MITKNKIVDFCKKEDTGYKHTIKIPSPVYGWVTVTVPINIELMKQMKRFAFILRRNGKYIPRKKKRTRR